MSPEYNEDGLRTRRVFADGTKYEYHYNGTQLDYVKVNHSTGNLAHIFRYIYNSEGQAEYIMYIPADCAQNPNVFSLYYIVRDCEGKIHKLIKVRQPNSAKTGVEAVLKTAVTYTYDPYGKRLNTTYATGEYYIYRFNILLYKDYLYDEETGFYYLQSRYYDPEIGRFINADSYVESGAGINDTNMFAYCVNDPIVLKDNSGYRPIASMSVNDEDELDRKASCAYMNELTRQKYDENSREEEKDVVVPIENYTFVGSFPNYRSGSFHGGLDIPAPQGVPVHSIAYGKVVAANSWSTSYGNHIVIESVINGQTYRIWYAHMNGFSRRWEPGNTVSKAQVIGYVGNTGNSQGNHLHFEVRKHPYRHTLSDVIDPRSLY